MTWQCRPFDIEREKKFREQGKDRLFSRLLSQRDIDPEKADIFLKANYADISHPHLLEGTKLASEIFCDVALKGGNVAVIGDYDVDGILSSTMIKELCILFELPCKVFLPSRTKHGYGLSSRSLSGFNEMVSNPKYDIDLLFILDCGSSNEEEIKVLREQGVKKIVIIDHHIINEEIMSKSADVLINWHLCDHDEMCAAGEVYQFIRAIRCKTNKINPIEFISYASIATIGDVSPLRNDNRIIVKNGLTKYALDHVIGYGLNALIRQSRLDPAKLSQSDIAFKIAPKLNASGRVADPDLSYHLMVEPDLSKVESIAEKVNELNEQRKNIQKKIECEAIAEVNNHLFRYKDGIFLHNSEWHTGVLGIVASRVAEHFKKPTVITAMNGNDIKGSGRSCQNINLKEILDECQDLFLTYGGHALAAGVTVDPSKISKVYERFNQACLDYKVKHSIGQNVNYYDAELKPSSVSFDTAKMLMENLYPYYENINPEPVFLISSATINSVELIEAKGWKILKFSVEKDGNEVPFRMIMFTEEYGTELEGVTADLYFQFPQSSELNAYGAYILNVIDILTYSPYAKA